MAAANLDACPAIVSGIVAPNATNLVLLFALDSIPVSKQRLVCRWHRNADGRLRCAWAKHILRSRILDPKEPVQRFLARTPPVSFPPSSPYQPYWLLELLRVFRIHVVDIAVYRNVIGKPGGGCGYG
jgi:hypothetical protein